MRSRSTPGDTKQGFIDGHINGREFVEHGIPFAIGHTIGFGCGATEALVGVVAMPAKSLFDWVAWALDNGSRCGDENTVQAEKA